MPYATASPCRNRRYCVAASSAWPTVWPKFRTRRAPASRSSAATMAALIRQQSAMTGVSAPTSRRVSGPIRAEPRRTAPVARHAVLDDFVEARPELAAGQRREQGRIDDDDPRLVEGADEVLAAWQVDTHLAADGRVDLREQRRRHVREGDAAHVRGGGEAAHVADDAAAEGDQRGDGRRRPEQPVVDAAAMAASCGAPRPAR